MYTTRSRDHPLSEKLDTAGILCKTGCIRYPLLYLMPQDEIYMIIRGNRHVVYRQEHAQLASRTGLAAISAMYPSNQMTQSTWRHLFRRVHCTNCGQICVQISQIDVMTEHHHCLQLDQVTHNGEAEKVFSSEENSLHTQNTSWMWSGYHLWRAHSLGICHSIILAKARMILWQIPNSWALHKLYPDHIHEIFYI